MKRKKKIVICFFGVFIMFFILSYAMYKFDCYRVSNEEEPIFVIHTDVVNDGGSKFYYGPFYQIIVWNSIGVDYSDGSNIETHFLLGYYKPFD